MKDLDCDFCETGGFFGVEGECVTEEALCSCPEGFSGRGNHNNNSFLSLVVMTSRSR